ncbi:MAG: hypothetical protein JWM80_4830 [Cyanobacteria bacterium RYN_339]|nr:hypothetical protein [Cyanobacteria bacterium RYN_339]
MDEEALDAMIDRYLPPVAAAARAAMASMRTRFPGVHLVVYDKRTMLVIGFGASARQAETPFSIALYPRWVICYFLRGAGLQDPTGLLAGGGKVVRHLRLTRPDLLDDPAVQDLIDQTLARLREEGLPTPGTGDGGVTLKFSATTRP